VKAKNVHLVGTLRRGLDRGALGRVNFCLTTPAGSSPVDGLRTNIEKGWRLPPLLIEVIPEGNEWWAVLQLPDLRKVTGKDSIRLKVFFRY
jgi:hypothetical protein